MKLLDWVIIAAFFGCLGVVYGGYRMEGGLAATAVCLIASWRFYDRSREKHLMRGSSGTPVQDAPDSMLANTDYSHDSGSSGSSSSGGETD